MSYAIDVTRESIKKAMQILGINPEELVKKYPEDFASKSIDENIKNIRYNFFQRKQQELIRQIKSHMQEKYQRHIEKSKDLNNPTFTGTETSDLTKIESNYIARIKEKHKTLANKHLLDVIENIKGVTALETKLLKGKKNRENSKSAVSRQRIRMQEFKKLQAENYEKQQKAQELTNKSSSRLENFGIFSEISKNKKKTSYSPTPFLRTDSNSDTEIDTLIRKYEEKMDKSKHIYNSFLKNKQQAISRILEKSLKTTKNLNSDKPEDYNDKLVKLVEKTYKADKRRDVIIKTQTEKRIRQKEIQDQRRSLTRSKMDEKQKDIEKKLKEIEEKMRRSEQFLEKKHDKWLKEQEIRNEIQRLKDEETLMNVERKKRISKYRRDLIIEKQIDDSNRIQIMKEERESEVRKKMELATKSMIEKERYYETITDPRVEDFFERQENSWVTED